jgi:hypothetical protein
MNPEQVEAQVAQEIQQYLNQIAFELEEAASGARGAAEAIPDRVVSWQQAQKMYTRFQQASYLVNQLQKTIDDAVRPTSSNPQ